MKTAYPFEMPAHVISRLASSPELATTTGGLRDLDVKVNGAWDGILVVDAAGHCVGIRLGGRVQEYPLVFTPAQIEDVRPACLGNRILAYWPYELYSTALVTVLIVSPILNIAPMLLGWPLGLCTLLSGIAAGACVFSIYVMYQAGGFPLFRLPVALFGLGQMIFGVRMLVALAFGW